MASRQGTINSRASVTKYEFEDNEASLGEFHTERSTRRARPQKTYCETESDEEFEMEPEEKKRKKTKGRSRKITGNHSTRSAHSESSQLHEYARDKLRLLGLLKYINTRLCSHFCGK